MSRHNLKELRRYAGMGQQERVKRVLEGMLAQDPEDCFAIAEMQRLLAGKELYSTLDYKNYRRILHEAAEESLRMLMLRYPLDSKGRMPKEKLRKVLDCIDKQEGRLQDGQKIPTEATEYRSALRREFGKRTLLANRRTLAWVGVPLALLALVGFGAWQIHHRAEKTAQALEKAVAAGDWQKVLMLRDTADSGVHRLLYPATEAGVKKADAWIAHKKAIHREASALIRQLHDGVYGIETMPLTQRALMERYLRDLPQELDDISADWKRYCRQVESEWLQQIPGILARIQAPLPLLPEWSGTAQDAEAAEQYGRRIAGLLREYEDVVDAYHLDAALLKPVRERLDAVRRLQKELTLWQRTLEGLAEAKNYGSYRTRLAQIGAPTSYPPAMRLAASLPHFPSEQDVADAMKDRGGKVPPGLLPAMQRVLLERGGTFCKEGPAIAGQVELLDDLFTTRTLRTKLYRISTPQGEVGYSTAPFEKKGGGDIAFKRAELDPAYRIGQETGVVWKAAGVRQQAVDPRGLVAAAGLERRSFFIHANLPAALGAVLNYRHKDCPALAKAYVYDILMRTMQMHRQPELIGVEFSPSLLADTRAFTRMKHTLGIELGAGCWLQPTQRTAAAEALAQAWFNERKGHDYAAEIEKNYGAIAAVHPVYVGYMGADGKAVLCREVKKGDELWCQRGDGLYGDFRSEAVYAGAVPFSPLFIKARDKKKKR